MPTKTEWGILIFNILYLILFGIYFFIGGNFEFLWYIFILIAMIVVFSLLHKKYQFSNLTLIGLSVWGIAHMFGGSTLFGDANVYSRIIFNLFTTGDTTLISYDHILHFYFYLVITSVVYQIARKYFSPVADWKIIAIFIFLVSMGIGSVNEIIEFSAVLFLAETGVGGYYNVAWDIVFNAVGALVAIIYISWMRKRETDTVFK